MISHEIITSCNSLVAIQAGNACVLNGVVAPLLARLQVQCEPHCWGCDWLPVAQLSLARGSDWSLATSSGTVSGEGQATQFPVGYRAEELQVSFSVVDGFYNNVSHIPRLHKTYFSKHVCISPETIPVFRGVWCGWPVHISVVQGVATSCYTDAPVAICDQPVWWQYHCDRNAAGVFHV